MSEHALYLKVEECPSAPRQGEPHCDHETGSVREGGKLTQRTWTCCHCGRRWVEEIKPLPEIHAGWVQKKHGPHVPPFVITNYKREL